jgi:hypothetical protein
MPVEEPIAKRTPAAMTANKTEFPPSPEKVATPIIVAKEITVRRIYPLLIPATLAVI